MLKRVDFCDKPEFDVVKHISNIKISIKSDFLLSDLPKK